MWQNFKTSNIAYSQLCKKLSLFKSIPSRLIKKSAYCSTENTITNKFDVVFSYCGNNVKEFILLLPYNKSLEMHELNEQNIQYLTALNINIHKIVAIKYNNRKEQPFIWVLFLLCINQYIMF